VVGVSYMVVIGVWLCLLASFGFGGFIVVLVAVWCVILMFYWILL